MRRNHLGRKQPRFLLLYSPLQFGPEEIAKPDGSLSLPYLAGALRQADFDVRILDVSVGSDEDDLAETFFRPVRLENGLYRVGMSPQRILDEVFDWDVVAISSIFTAQTRMVLDTVRLIREVFPEKLILAGGVNARSLRDRFFDAGVDVIALSEGEEAVVAIGRVLREGSRDFREVPGIAMRVGGHEVVNPARSVVMDLDRLPMPAWDLLPHAKYWAISRPHGGEFEPGREVRYAAMMTSRGCPFACTFCHISQEDEASPGGPIGSLRLKSHDRVIREFGRLKSLGVEYVFIEDDSLLAKKPRIIRIIRALRAMGMTLADVNGVNVAHLFKNDRGKLVVDRELIDMMVDVGFRTLSLPFESANQRILDRYASSKWRTDKLDTVALVRACVDAGLDVDGNYMIGFPGETRAEIHRTLDLARQHVDAGLMRTSFFAVIPYPGTTLYDECIRTAAFSSDFDPDVMKWTKPILSTGEVSREELAEIRQHAWLTLNRPDYVTRKLSMTVAKAG